MLPWFRRLQPCLRFTPLLIFTHLGAGSGDFLAVDTGGGVFGLRRMTFSRERQSPDWRSREKPILQRAETGAKKPRLQKQACSAFLREYRRDRR
jgi:hypothetical protein